MGRQRKSMTRTWGWSRHGCPNQDKCNFLQKKVGFSWSLKSIIYAKEPYKVKNFPSWYTSGSTFRQWPTRQFTHNTSSLYFPQGNGEVEWAVKMVKFSVKKEKDLYLALLVYRTTPLRCGYCPAELLVNRQLCSALRQCQANLLPQCQANLLPSVRLTYSPSVRLTYSPVSG